MTIDEHQLAELTARSRDLHRDAMHAAREPLAEIVEVGHDQRARNEGGPEAGRVFARRRSAHLGKGLGLALPPPDLNALPAAAGNVGFPNAFSKTDMARPADEGAVQ